MNIRQFLIIFWSRRVLIVAATVSCLVGALIVSAIVPPTWESTARIMLNYIKPDPVTGEVVVGAATRAYVSTQTELITDYSVTKRVAQQIGWFSDPVLIEKYQSRSKDDPRDFSTWLADLVMQNTKAKLVEDSNIIEITYGASTPEGAKAVADALVKAYMDELLEERHESAERNAVWYTAQTVKAKEALDQAVAAEAAFARANNVVMLADKVDAEVARLQTLNVEPTPLVTPQTSTAGSPANLGLATIEAQLAAAKKIYGPNNPQIVDLESRRASLAALAERERTSARQADAKMASNGLRTLDTEVTAQKAKVIADSEKIGRLNQLHQTVLLRRDEYDHAGQKATLYRQLADSSELDVTPLGAAATPKQPLFPNYLLIVPGAIILGMGVGVMTSLLIELLQRRVRMPEDLNFNDAAAPSLICLVPALDTPNRKRTEGFWRQWTRRWPRPFGMGGAVGA